MKVVLKKGKSEEFKKYVFLSAFSPIYMIVFGGLIAGTVLTLVRFNYWKFIYPFLIRILPPMFFISLFLSFIYFFIAWIKIKDAYNRIKELEEKGIESEKEFIDLTNLISKLPQDISLVSTIIWIVSIPVGAFVMWLVDVADFQTIIFLSLCILGLSFPVSLTNYFALEKVVKNVFEGVKEIPWNVYPTPSVPVRIKIIGTTLSALLFLFFFITALHLETTVKSMKYEKAKSYIEKFVGGEEIRGSINFQITKGGGIKSRTKEEEGTQEEEKEKKLHPILDEYVFSGIIDKVEMGENILLDYLSPGVYLFFLRGEIIEGTFIPMTWVEDYVKKHLAIFIPVGVVIVIISLTFIYLSVGRHISEFFQEIESQIFLSDDETFKVSLMYSNLRRDFEKLKKRYISLSTEVGSNYSQVYSDLVSLRSKLHQLVEETKRTKSVMRRIISFVKKEFDDEDISDIDMKIEPISTSLNQAIKDVKNIKNKIDNIFSDISRSIGSIPKGVLDLGVSTVHEGKFSAVETSITKKIDMMKSDVRDTVKMLSKIQDRVNSILNYIGGIEDNMNRFGEISEEIDKLRKRIVILSMNTAIVSAKSSDEETRGKISTIAKHMARMTEDIKRIESDTKGIHDSFQKALMEFQSFSENGFVRDIISDIKAFIERVGDTVDDLSNQFENILGEMGETKKNVKQIVDEVDEAKRAITSLKTSLENIEMSKDDISDEFNSVLSNLENLSKILSDSEIKMERVLGQTQTLISRYMELKREMKSTFSNIQLELRQGIKMIEGVEERINEIKMHVDSMLNFFLDLIQSFSEQ